MASELRVNTLKDASGNNSVPLSTVATGTAKHRAQHAAGTLQSGSLNCSSITDTGTGAFTHNYSNNFFFAKYKLVLC